MRFRTSLLAIAFVLAPVAAIAEDKVAELTPEAATAVKTLFPEATVMGVGQEREQGVQYYEVAVRDGSQRIEIEVTADGAIGEVESVVDIATVPQAAREQIQRNTRGAEVKHVERHEVRGTPQNGTFAPVNPPVVLFEVSYKESGRTREFVVAADGSRPAPEQAEQEDDDDGPEEEEEDD